MPPSVTICKDDSGSIMLSGNGKSFFIDHGDRGGWKITYARVEIARSATKIVALRMASSLARGVLSDIDSIQNYANTLMRLEEKKNEDKAQHSRFIIQVDSICYGSDHLEESVALFYTLMPNDMETMRQDLLTHGKYIARHQKSVGSIIDRSFKKVRTKDHYSQLQEVLVGQGADKEPHIILVIHSDHMQLRRVRDNWLVRLGMDSYQNISGIRSKTHTNLIEIPAVAR